MLAKHYAAIYGPQRTDEQRHGVERQYRILRPELLASGLSQQEVGLVAPLNDAGFLDWEPREGAATE